MRWYDLAAFVLAAFALALSWLFINSQNNPLLRLLGTIGIPLVLFLAAVLAVIIRYEKSE